MPAVLHLGRWTLADALTRSLNLAAGNAVSAGEQLPNDFAKGMSGVLRPVLEPLLSLLLYLCSQAAEVGDGQRRPANPEPKRVKGGLRLFVAERPTTWDVGVRLGAALRQAYAAEQTGQVAGHVGPRPPLRRPVRRRRSRASRTPARPRRPSRPWRFRQAEEPSRNGLRSEGMKL